MNSCTIRQGNYNNRACFYIQPRCLLPPWTPRPKSSLSSWTSWTVTWPAPRRACWAACEPRWAAPTRPEIWPRGWRNRRWEDWSHRCWHNSCDSFNPHSLEPRSFLLACSSLYSLDDFLSDMWWLTALRCTYLKYLHLSLIGSCQGSEGPGEEEAGDSCWPTVHRFRQYLLCTASQAERRQQQAQQHRSARWPLHQKVSVCFDLEVARMQMHGERDLYFISNKNLRLFPVEKLQVETFSSKNEINNLYFFSRFATVADNLTRPTLINDCILFSGLMLLSTWRIRSRRWTASSLGLRKSWVTTVQSLMCRMQSKPALRTFGWGTLTSTT